MESAALKIHKDDKSLNDYVDSAYYLAFHIASLTTAYKKMRANPSLGHYMAKAGDHLERLAQMLSAARHDSFQAVSEKAGAIMAALAVDTAGLAGARMEGRKMDVERLLEHHEAYAFKQSFEIVARSTVASKEAFSRLDTLGLAESRF